MSGARPIALLMALEAASLGVMSLLHFAGALNGTKPFQPTRAGIAEALIGAVLLIGALALWSRWPHARAVAIAANALAIAGFVIGLTRTIQGGGPVDIGYHLAVLPLLVGTLIALTRSGTSSQSRDLRRTTTQH